MSIEQQTALCQFLIRNGPATLEDICLGTRINTQWARYLLTLHNDIFDYYHDDLVKHWFVIPEELRHDWPVRDGLS